MWVEIGIRVETWVKVGIGVAADIRVEIGIRIETGVEIEVRERAEVGIKHILIKKNSKISSNFSTHMYGVKSLYIFLGIIQGYDFEMI